MDCRRAKKLINLYLDGEADDLQTQVLFSHLEKCSKCQIRLEELRGLHKTIRTVPDLELPVGFRSKIMEGVVAAEFQPEQRSLALRPIIIWGSIAAMILIIFTIVWNIYQTDEVVPDKQELQMPLAREYFAFEIDNNGPKSEGESVVVEVSQIGSEVSNELSYSFDWDDDGIYDILDQKSSSAPHIWNDDGIYIVRVQIKDGNDEIYKAVTSVKVNDLAPTAEFTFAPEMQYEGSPVLFADASISSPDDIVLWSWDFGDTVGTSVNQNPSYIYRENGTYTVTLTVEDEDGSSISKRLTVVVNNASPSLVAGADQIIAVEGTPVSLPPFTFTDPGVLDTHIANIDWGDGVTEVCEVDGNAIVTGKHIYNDNGIYKVTITVVDDDEASASDTLTVTVDNASPSLVAGIDRIVTEGTPVNLPTFTFTDPGVLDTHTATIDWGDGVTEICEVNDNAIAAGKHIYNDNGIYKVTITVVDDDKASASDTLTVTVDNASPSLAIGPDQIVAEGAPVSLPPSVFTDPGVLDTHTATINWGDGVTEVGALDGNFIVAGKHIYADNGIYEITITVVDDDGASTSDVLAVTVNNQPPSVGQINMSLVDAKEKASIVELNTTVEFNAKIEDPGTQDSHIGKWDWGDGTTDERHAANIVSGKHSYDSPGVYAVTLRVTDDDGDWSESILEYVVVFDPSGEFAAGGGRINSPAGAYMPDKSFADKAAFGFVFEYDDEGDISTGKTELRLHVADLDFCSNELQWQMVVGTKGQFRGKGNINNIGDYLFLLSVIDGGIDGNGVDKLLIKIWQEEVINGEKLEAVIYDNQIDYARAGNVNAVESGGIVVRVDSLKAPENEFRRSQPNASRMPEISLLLTPYPQPANPEVWIPYQLDSGNQVVIRIHDATGRLVRALDIGYKEAGFYASRSQAAYWDGNNAAGERVSSGVYFYTIQSGGFEATGKIIITK